MKYSSRRNYFVLGYGKWDTSVIIENLTGSSICVLETISGKLINYRFVFYMSVFEEINKIVCINFFKTVRNGDLWTILYLFPCLFWQKNYEKNCLKRVGVLAKSHKSDLEIFLSIFVKMIVWNISKKSSCRRKINKIIVLISDFFLYSEKFFTSSLFNNCHKWTTIPKSSLSFK